MLSVKLNLDERKWLHTSRAAAQGPAPSGRAAARAAHHSASAEAAVTGAAAGGTTARVAGLAVICLRRRRSGARGANAGFAARELPDACGGAGPLPPRGPPPAVAALPCGALPSALLLHSTPGNDSLLLLTCRNRRHQRTRWQRNESGQAVSGNGMKEVGI